MLKASSIMASRSVRAMLGCAEERIEVVVDGIGNRRVPATRAARRLNPLPQPSSAVLGRDGWEVGVCLVMVAVRTLICKIWISSEFAF